MDALMSGMSGGMDMGSNMMFRPYNQKLALGYWYIIAGLRRSKIVSLKYPTKPSNRIQEIYATATAIFRESSYPQIHISTPYLSWLSPPSSGRTILLLCYWAILIFMMTYDVTIKDAYYYERIGFRGAWISVTQVPLIYLLSSKSNIIGALIGSSHERLNWFHRWVSRTLLLTVTVHGAFFFQEWVRADFVSFELKLMPMVKYGMGAWGILLWTFLSSLSPLRRMAYEVFVLQHIACAAVFLWLLYIHVPEYARYNVWFAVAAMSFDWVLRGILLIVRNFRVKVVGAACRGMQRVGHQAELQALSADITIISIKDAPFTWKAGQHMYLWLPRLGPLETHPFTIASPYQTSNKCHCNEIQLAIRAQKGFSRRIHNYASKMQSLDKTAILTAFVSGPYGVPPNWSSYETILLISASTGASYTLPILESILHNPTPTCVQRIQFLLVRASLADKKGIQLIVKIAVTGNDGASMTSSKAEEGRAGYQSTHHQRQEDAAAIRDPVGRQTTTKSPYEVQTQSYNDEKNSDKTESLITTQQISRVSGDSPQPGGGCCCAKKPEAKSSEKSRRGVRDIIYLNGRPDISQFIRGPIEITGGETAITVCCGKGLVAKVRNSTAKLSDERAVHKGTGANGIFLHVEEYCF
ncbi:uncharacterized protein EAF02_006259 [Botrytis sinoallii]|uniref:uncharacterized protein n=1 Tax=Botrytis sinoallii TaxID=1463999 RepID=UPI0018FF89AE|nr:uncharacterized protein EAF02_006259 [Botrytis sinoallii]KAF7881571.1 hypothetical protein EAF02_006259 [Botrytis sinoallii]